MSAPNAGLAYLQALQAAQVRRGCHCANCRPAAPAQPAATASIQTQFMPLADYQLLYCRERNGDWSLRTLADCKANVTPGTVAYAQDGRPVWLALPNEDGDD